MKKRVSRRKYHPGPLEENDREVLEESIKELREDFPLANVLIKQEGFDKVSNKIVGSYGLVSGASSFAIIMGKTSDDKFKANIHAGVMGEGLILEATSLGLNTCWMGGFFDREILSSRSEINDDEEILAITPLGKAKDSLTITERLVKFTAGSRKRKPLSELCDEDFSDKSQEWMTTAVKLARQAPSAMNRQPWRFGVEENELILRSMMEKSDNISPYLDCGIALLHLLVGAGVEDVDADIEYGEPPVVARVRP